jgi:aminoglycoside phosphotransferase family enzyme
MLELYRRCARDECGRSLLQFHRALRAHVRAKVAAWHLEEDDMGGPARAAWHHRAQWYIDAAAESLGFVRPRAKAATLT